MPQPGPSSPKASKPVARKSVHGPRPSRRGSLFQFEDAGLGLEVDVSSGSTSDSAEAMQGSAGVTRHEFAIPAMKTATPPSVHPPEPNRSWVRNLLVLRRQHLFVAEGGREADLTAKEMNRLRGRREWLRQQHGALEDGTISVTLKCVLAASGTSKLFSACSDAFMKPEYRSRYWDWCVNFVKLMDVTISHDNPNVVFSLDTEPGYDAVVAFARGAVEQRGEGRLSPHKEALLSALGLRWSTPPAAATQAVEGVVKRDGGEANGGKEEEDYEEDGDEENKGGKAEAEADDKDKGLTLDEMVEQVVGGRGSAEDGKLEKEREEMVEWSRNFCKLRQWYRSGAKRYAVPGHLAEVRIWQNAEVARSSTGALGRLQCGVLRVGAVMGTDEEGRKLGKRDMLWCERFVEYVDVVIGLEGARDGGMSLGLAQFLTGCRLEMKRGRLEAEKEGLLGGVERDWMRDVGMRAAVGRMRQVVGQAQKRRGGTDGVGGSDGAGGSAEGERKRARPGKCQEMVSSMIKGIVGESVGGRNKTNAEKDAEAWVARAGVQALNRYAQKWFQSADVEE